MLMRFLIVLTILASSSISNAEKLNRSEINKSLAGIKSVPLIHKGQKGVWFPEADAEVLLNLVSIKLRLSLDIIDDQSDQIDKLNISIENYKEVSNNYKQLAQYNQDMFDIAMKHIPNLKPPEYSWYEKPGSMFMWGAITGAIVTLGLTYAAVSTVEAAR